MPAVRSPSRAVQLNTRKLRHDASLESNSSFISGIWVISRMQKSCSGNVRCDGSMRCSLRRHRQAPCCRLSSCLRSLEQHGVRRHSRLRENWPRHLGCLALVISPSSETHPAPTWVAHSMTPLRGCHLAAWLGVDIYFGTSRDSKDSLVPVFVSNRNNEDAKQSEHQSSSTDRKQLLVRRLTRWTGSCGIADIASLSDATEATGVKGTVLTSSAACFNFRLIADNCLATSPAVAGRESGCLDINR